MTETYQNFIGGQWVGSASGRFMPNINPANRGDVIGQVPLSTSAEALEAVASAHQAYESWSRVPAPKRGDIVLRAWKIMESRKEEIGRKLAREEGKILGEALGEVQKTLNCLEYLGGEGRRISGVSRESELVRNYAFTRKVPLGVVALITPWNFPVAIPAWKIAPALVTGNTVVLKPSELTPATAQDVVQCFVDAGVPDGVLNLVHGLGEEVGAALVEAPEVRAVSFTGSNEVGQHIYAQGAARGIRVQCEMGGKNPIIVLEDADVELAAAATAAGAFGSTGQRCTATSRAIVHESIADAYVARVKELAEKVVPGDPLVTGVTMGPSVDAEQFDLEAQRCVGRDNAAGAA